MLTTKQPATVGEILVEEFKARSATRGYKGGERAMLRELGRALRESWGAG